MDLTRDIKEHAKRVNSLAGSCETEEATKTALILPFLRVLGYDPFNPLEVVPEFSADVGTKKGEKVDYAIRIDGKLAILIEAKAAHVDLGKSNFAQLYSQIFRYFGTTEANFAILTNGIEYKFFTDLDDQNKLDKLPFFSFSLAEFDDENIKELGRFTRDKFDVGSIRNTASLLRNVTAAVDFLETQMQSPSDEFVRLVAKQIYDGNVTAKVVEQLRGPIQQAFNKIIREKAQNKFNQAFGANSEEASIEVSVPENKEPAAEIETTQEELEGFYIVRAICAELVDPNRIFIRDARTYCGILFDDNNRKPVARLHFNSPKNRSISLFDAGKTETRVKISDTSEIYGHAKAIRDVVKSYLEALT